MARTQYRCGTPERRALVLQADATFGQSVLNGIDFLEVASADQRTLELTFLRPLPGETDGVPAAPPLGVDDIVIEGGVRVRDIVVTAVTAADDRLTVEVDRAGDFSTYVLRLVAGAAAADPPAGFDPLLSEVAFSFKADCPSDFDCKPERVCPPVRLPQLAIDYLAKDYASFRRLLLDRLAVTLPEWKERNAADLGVAVVELLAYRGDHLSYHQDVVAAEAYFTTARRRTSVRRHARLLDYAMHDGACARAWVALEVDGPAAGVVLPGPRMIESGAAADSPGTRFVTRALDLPPTIDAAGAEAAVRAGAETFEALHDLTLRSAWSEIRFYTWGDEDCCLPRGATRAYLRNPGDVLAELEPGAVLIFEEVRGANSGRVVDRDPSRRHAVRLTEVSFLEDALFPDDPAGDAASPRLRVVEIGWAEADALPFPLCLRDIVDPEQPGEHVPVSVVRGNVVLVEHGLTHVAEELPPVDGTRYRPALGEAPVACSGRVTLADGRAVPFEPAAPAAAALVADARTTLPGVYLRETSAGDRLWTAQRDLLGADAFDRELVVEIEEDGTARLRFGDGIHGSAPDAGATFAATYRVGGGDAGNVGAEAIAHAVIGEPSIVRVRNPLPAAGGVVAETLDHVRLNAPHAFRTQERAVTEADYAAAAQRHPSVQRAAATFRWTGSWHTVFLTIDRRGGRPVDAAFEEELVSFLERFPLAGYDLEVEPPIFVPLDITLTVCVQAGVLRSDVHVALLDTFSSRDLPDGRRGFFHPDSFTFGQPVYLSRIVAEAMEVPGVRWIDVDDSPPKPNRFQRYGEPARGELDEGLMRMARLEIARLDNDPSVPENGRIEFVMEGGL